MPFEINIQYHTIFPFKNPFRVTKLRKGFLLFTALHLKKQTQTVIFVRTKARYLLNI
jgi:hypothetical protein